MTSRMMIGGAMVLLGLVALPAAAQTVDAAKPATVVAALQSAGYKAVLDKDSGGDPKITSAAAGANFTILFYGCESNVSCKSVQFTAGYTMKVKPAIAKVNDWNLNNRFACAYIDKDGDPDIQFDLVTQGGLAQSLFVASLSHWTDAMGSFQTFIGW